MSSEYMQLFMDQHPHRKGDLVSVGPDLFKVVMVCEDSILLRKLNARQRAGVWLRKHWPFRFRGFWRRVWTNR